MRLVSFQTTGAEIILINPEHVIGVDRLGTDPKTLKRRTRIILTGMIVTLDESYTKKSVAAELGATDARGIRWGRADND